MRIGASYFPIVGEVPTIAATAERLGLDDLSLGDSPQLAGELYTSLMAASNATSTIEIVAGVTNSVTRDPVVTASGVATVQVASGGRVVCGLGRGDSAVLKIGKRPDTVERFEEYVVMVRRYLDGDVVQRNGMDSTIPWVRDVARVPIEIVATGPKVLAVAARHADRIGLGLGADPEWVALGVQRARRAVADAGRDPLTVEIGAYLPCNLNSSTETAVETARYIAAKFANFRALGKQSVDDLPGPLARAVEQMRTAYDYAADPGVAAADDLDETFVRWMAVVGDGDQASERLAALADTGLAYVRLMSGFHRLSPELASEHHRILGDEVVPRMRQLSAR
jgi:5,10-methylenetetrahydromethanopterin reductase